MGGKSSCLVKVTVGILIELKAVEMYNKLKFVLHYSSRVTDFRGQNFRTACVQKACVPELNLHTQSIIAEYEIMVPANINSQLDATGQLHIQSLALMLCPF